MQEPLRECPDCGVRLDTGERACLCGFPHDELTAIWRGPFRHERPAQEETPSEGLAQLLLVGLIALGAGALAPALLIAGLLGWKPAPRRILLSPQGIGIWFGKRRHTFDWPAIRSVSVEGDAIVIHLIARSPVCIARVFLNAHEGDLFLHEMDVVRTRYSSQPVPYDACGRP